jgi:hypothetical protein
LGQRETKAGSSDLRIHVADTPCALNGMGDEPGSSCWQVSWLTVSLPRLPPSRSNQWHMTGADRLQLRGQPRFWPLMGNPHRVPF